MCSYPFRSKKPVAKRTAGQPKRRGATKAPASGLLGSLGFALTLLCSQAALAAEHEIPLFISASNAMQQGFARIVNHSDESGTVSIRAIDDSGRAFGPFQVSLDPWDAMHFNSDHLEMGDSSRGITGIGGGTGDWRLVLTSDLNIEVLAYVRTQDGFLTSMHDAVRKPGARHLVPVFNPGSNSRQASRLRLVNPSAGSARVTIAGADDQGTRTSEVSLSVPAGEARSITAQQLERGHSSLTGRLGTGTGKWRLFVTSNRDIHVMSLLESASGHLTNLSTSTAVADFPLPQRVAQIAPADQAAFNALVVGKRMQGDDPNNYVDFVSAGRFSETEGSDVWTGRYAYTNTGPDTATVTLNYDDGDRCTYSLTFATATSGSGTFTCSDGASGSTGWRIAETPPQPPQPPQPPTGTDPYERLDTIEVSPGRVRFGFISAGRCIRVRNTSINGVTYTIESSKWQRRPNANSAWADIAGTEENGQMCSLNPSESGAYRLVAEITIDGSTGMYASNTMRVN